MKSALLHQLKELSAETRPWEGELWNRGGVPIKTSVFFLTPRRGGASFSAKRVSRQTTQKPAASRFRIEPADSFVRRRPPSSSTPEAVLGRKNFVR